VGTALADLHSFDPILPSRMAARDQAGGVFKAGLDAVSLFDLANRPAQPGLPDS